MKKRKQFENLKMWQFENCRKSKSLHHFQIFKLTNFQIDPMAIHVAIVEDNKMILEGLKAMVDFSPDLFCAGVFEDAESLMKSFKHFDRYGKKPCQIKGRMNC